MKIENSSDGCLYSHLHLNRYPHKNRKSWMFLSSEILTGNLTDSGVIDRWK